MGLDITAYSRLRHVAGEGDLGLYKGDFDRMDGRPEGSYVRTTDADVWWRAEHGADLPQGERAAIDDRVAALRGGLKPECPGDLAVLSDARAVTEELGFQAGSYSGYNRWRENLCLFAHGVDPETIWFAEDVWEGKPFFELILFSDAQGTIGPETSAKLAKDFAFYELHCLSRAQEIPDEGEREWFIEKYEDWRAAFELAAQDGFVIFH